jgi:hypothetical protein
MNLQGVKNLKWYFQNSIESIEGKSFIFTIADGGPFIRPCEGRVLMFSPTGDFVKIHSDTFNNYSSSQPGSGEWKCSEHIYMLEILDWSGK